MIKLFVQAKKKTDVEPDVHFSWLDCIVLKLFAKGVRVKASFDKDTGI